MFIILGVLLLLTVILVVYYATQEEPVRRAPAVPEFAAPVQDYVQECLYDISRDGVALMGAQGGYINIPASIANTPDAYIPNDALGVVKTPLWYFDAEDRVPSLDYMQDELARYVRERLPQCIDGFRSFEQFDVSYQEILPVVTFTSDDVVVELRWPVRVESAGSTADIESFITTLDVPIREMWFLADSVMQEENRVAWFENLTIDLLSADPEIPMNGVLFECGIKKWRVSELKDRFSEVLYYNIPRIRVADTNYPPPERDVSVYDGLKRDRKRIVQDLVQEREVDWPEDTPIDAFEFNRMMFDVGYPSTDLKVGFQFLPDWSLRFVGRPHSGGVMSSALMKGMQKYLSFLCINAYHFTYDVIYPVKAMIRDDDAFDGDGFVFQFGFPVIVKNNAAQRVFFGTNKFEEPIVYSDFCEQLSDEVLDVRVKGFVEDSPVAEELAGVNITYHCLNQYCDLGETYSDGSGNVRLNTYLPYGCSNPRVTAEKPGYVPVSRFVKPGVNELEMTMLKELDVVPRIYPYQDPPGTWQLAQVREYLTDTQELTVRISIRDEAYDQTFQLVNDSAVELVYGDARYDIDAILTQAGQVVGGYHAENITIEYDDFAGSDTMVLNVVEFRPMKEDRADMYMFLYENGMMGDESYKFALRPDFR